MEKAPQYICILNTTEELSSGMKRNKINPAPAEVYFSTFAARRKYSES
jgi:hypothetical protein